MSTKGRIAVNAVVDLALREHAGPVTLASIGERQHTSLSYLEQMFSRLRRAGIVESTRGPGGGYTLGRPAAAITVADIVTAVDAPPGGADGAQAGAGHTQALWQHLGEVMVRHMAAISLASVVASERTRGVQVDVPDARAVVRHQFGEKWLFAAAQAAVKARQGYGLGLVALHGAARAVVKSRFEHGL
ncbi:MAG TPA: Rrf2 family transcriptional regulator, partial [Rubrivivax sp.]|nr:Rrf2 family transcriptional regulator [Rubrivivax sp.]